jgi:hypothetical protein
LGLLESLTIQEGRITGKGLEHLKAMGRLTALTLNDTETTDQDLILLGELVLENTEVTDAGLLRHAECQQLESITVKGRHITTEGLEKLLQQLPNCRQLGK